MRIKIFILKLIFALILFSQNSFAKSLPPGSGSSDVPANVLILLDTSGSMAWNMATGSGFFYPSGVAVDENGDIYAGQKYAYGIKKISYNTEAVDKSFASNGTYFGTGDCRADYVMDMKVHNGFLYVTSSYNNSVFRINLATGVCDWSQGNIYFPGALSIRNDILYAFGYPNRRGMRTNLTRNLSTNTNIDCNNFYNDNTMFSVSSAIDASGNNLYVWWYNWGSRWSSISRYPINRNTGCYSRFPSWGTTFAGQISTNAINGMTMNISRWRAWSAGMEAHPTDDDILYLTDSDWGGSHIFKLTMGVGNVRYEHVGEYSTSLQSNTGRIFLAEPRGIAIDSVNNRLIVANFLRNGTTILDYNLGFIKEIGGNSGTRLEGAVDAIEAVVTDSSLTAGVNFGFGTWDDPGGQYGMWIGDITTGYAAPCPGGGCLRTRVHKQGASRINQILPSVSAGGSTDAYSFAKLASDYLLHNTDSPIDASLACQNTYIIIIGDGDWGNHSLAEMTISNLYNQHNIKTFSVAYGGGISANGLNLFSQMAVAGGTNNVIIADTPSSLKSQLKAAISQIIASKLSFTAPAITSEIQSGGSLFQAQFDYVQNQQWSGTLKKTAISSNGILDENSSSNWDATDQLPPPNSRKIWTVIQGLDYKTDYNNFTDTNWGQINQLFLRTNNVVSNYHSISDNPINSQRCKNTSGVANGNEDDIKGLINFVRGQDYFDYDGDCDLTEARDNPLGDIYHSELVTVGAPNAETAFTGKNQEAYFRSINNYDTWAASKSNREEIIYVGANDGMLHAFNAKTGVEEWAFVPPFIASSMPTMINVNLNQTLGGSNAIYGVDGSPVVHDMYFRSAFDSAKQWHTILMIPYGRGGAGFSVLDITDPKKPLHLYSVLNDNIHNKVHVMDHNGLINSYDYVANSYPLSSLVEAIEVTENANNNVGNEVCNNSGDDRCFKSKTWTLPPNLQNVTASDLTVILDDMEYTKFSIGTHTSGPQNGRTYIQFKNKMTYYGYDSNSQSSSLGIYLKPGSALTGVQTQREYDYSSLGETWSSPRIIRLPNTGAGDNLIDDDIYVAVMGGGYGVQHSGLGSNLTIVNLEDTTHPGKIEKVIPIEDLETNDIVNSTPGSPVVITPDTAISANYKGAIVYLSDLEGKITKFNLTNMDNDGEGNSIALYDSTTLFTAGSNSINGRYMYHSMDATIGQSTNSLWLYAGTGDYERIADTSSGIQNLMLGIADPDFPMYKELNSPTTASDLTKCKNTTDDTTGVNCPVLNNDIGWYINLPDSQKVTAEPSIANGLSYFPVYRPSTGSNGCSIGDAFICANDDECGTNASSSLGTFQDPGDKCLYVGKGVLTKIVFFKDKLFANIAGESNQNIKDLVALDIPAGDITGYRGSWRENF